MNSTDKPWTLEEAELLAAHGFRVVRARGTTSFGIAAGEVEVHPLSGGDREFCCFACGVRGDGLHWRRSAEDALRHIGIEPQSAVVVLYRRIQVLRAKRCGALPMSLDIFMDGDRYRQHTEELDEAIEALDAERRGLIAR